MTRLMIFIKICWNIKILTDLILANTNKSILDIPIQNYYVNSINEINAILGHQQIDNILNTIKTYS